MSLNFHIGACRVELGFTCFALLAFTCLFAGAAGSAFLLLAVLLHEGAHIAAMVYFGAIPKNVSVSALGCRIELPQEKRLGYIESAAVSFAGPMCNLLCFLAFYLLGAASHPFAMASLVLGILQALPIEPLDGGLALRSLISQRRGDAQGERAAFILSLVFILPLGVLGFLILLRTRYNFTLLALSLYLMMYLVLKRDFFTA